MRKISSLTASFGGQTLLTFGSTIIIVALGFFTSALTARLLGPVGRGELAAVQTWGAFFATLALVGIPEAIVYMVGKDPRSAGKLMFSGSLLSLLAGLPVILLSYWLLPALLAEQRPAVAEIARWYTLWLFVLFAVNWAPLSILRGIRAFGIWNVLRPVPTIGWLIVLVAAFLVQNPTVEFLAAGFLMTYMASGLITLGIILRRVGGPYGLQVNLWPPLLKFGLPTTLSLLPNYLVQYGRLSQLIVAAVLSPEALGLIVVAISWSNITGIVPQSVGQVIFPRVAALDEGDERRAEVARATRLTILLSTATSLLFIVISPLVIPLVYGAEFSPAVAPALIMLLTAVPAALRKVAGDALRGLNRPQVALWGELVSLGATIILLLLLIQPLGIVGVALALLLSEVISSGVILALLSQTAQVSLVRLVVPTFQDVQTAAAFATRLRRSAS